MFIFSVYHEIVLYVDMLCSYVYGKSDVRDDTVYLNGYFQKLKLCKNLNADYHLACCRYFFHEIFAIAQKVGYLILYGIILFTYTTSIVVC